LIRFDKILERCTSDEGARNSGDVSLHVTDLLGVFIVVFAAPTFATCSHALHRTIKRAMTSDLTGSAESAATNDSDDFVNDSKQNGTTCNDKKDLLEQRSLEDGPRHIDLTDKIVGGKVSLQAEASHDEI